MSDYGEGKPPPPPYGGGSQGSDPYGQQPYGSQPPGQQPGQQPYGSQPPGQQPYGQPYGSPPPGQQPYGSPQGQPYGAPPSGDPYAQPSYGAAPPPPYGSAPPPPAYGAAPPYGAPAYGAPYGAAPYGGAPYGAPAVPGNLASMGKRFGARVIDGLIAGVIIFGLGAVIIGGAASTTSVDANGNVSGGGLLGGALFGYFALILVFSIAYEVVMIALRGATLGKMALGIKVVREADAGIPGWGPSVLRWVIPQVAGLVCGLITIAVYLSPFWDNTGRQQGWHDKVAHTLVVNAR